MRSSIRFIAAAVLPVDASEPQLALADLQPAIADRTLGDIQPIGEVVRHQGRLAVPALVQSGHLLGVRGDVRESVVTPHCSDPERHVARPAVELVVETERCGIGSSKRLGIALGGLSRLSHGLVGLLPSLVHLPFQRRRGTAGFELHGIEPSLRLAGALPGSQEQLQVRQVSLAVLHEQQGVDASLVRHQSHVGLDALRSGLDERQVGGVLDAPVVRVTADPVKDALALGQHDGRGEPDTRSDLDDVVWSGFDRAGR